MRDFQRQRVYNWENKHIAPFDKSRIPFSQIQSIVDYVWEQEKLTNPPRVFAFPKHVTTKCGDANRIRIRFHENEKTPTWVILHEIAHSLTMTFDWEIADRHGPEFVGMYIHLVSKHLKFQPLALAYTAQISGVKFTLGVTPAFTRKVYLAKG